MDGNNPIGPKKPASDDTAGNSKRSRGLGLVTPNACTECRKKRAKCDGQRPCARCRSQKSADCIYEVPVRQSKENMRAEIEQLRKHQQQSDSVLAALSSIPQADVVLDLLRKGESLEAISESVEKLRLSKSPSESNVTSYERASDQDAIRSAMHSAQILGAPLTDMTLNDAYEMGLRAQMPTSNFSNPPIPSSWPSSEGSPAAFAAITEPGDVMNWSPDNVPKQSLVPIIGVSHEQTAGTGESSNAILSARSQGQDIILGSEFGMENQTYTNPDYMSSWTSITSDTEFVEHLLALYFCWEYPTFASLSKEHFLEDFRLGRHTNCSSLLVNAILALGCRFSMQARARVVPDDPNTAGDHFFAEAKYLLDKEEDRHRLTTIQAMGLMSIREASCGRSSHSVYLSGQAIRLTIEMGLHLDQFRNDGKTSVEDRFVRAATFWGAFSLDQAWSLSIGRLPCFSKDINFIEKPDIVDHIEKSSWIPYTDDGIPLERSCTQPSNVRSVYQTFCELSEIVHKQLYAFYSPGNNLTSKILMGVYTKYLRWYEGIPSALRLGQNFTPAVLFAHMYYHYAILLLFRPFINLKMTDSEISPREVCNQAADAISTLVNSYSRLYTLRRTPSFVPYFVLTSSITHLVTLGNEHSSSEKVQQAIADLEEMKSCHRFASRSLDILKFLIRHWKINIPAGDMDDAKMKKLCRSLSTSNNQFCPNTLQHDMMKGIGRPVSVDDNPLFWPFPLQGRPMMGIGELLEPAGFEILFDAGR